MRSSLAFLAGMAAAAAVTVLLDRWLNADEFRTPFVGERPC